MNNPGSILKLWVKAVATHEKGKDPKSLPKKGQEQKPKIKHGLTTLKFQGGTDLARPANAERFIVLRDKVGKVMTRYCRYLKAAKDEDKQVLPRYLKTVTRLTAVVLKLAPGSISQDEEDPAWTAWRAWTSPPWNRPWRRPTPTRATSTWTMRRQPPHQPQPPRPATTAPTRRRSSRAGCRP
jgi:hypothetical protein